MKSGLSNVASSVPFCIYCPGSREVLRTMPPIVMATVACRWGGSTIVPLKETWLGFEVAEVMPSTCMLSPGVDLETTAVSTVTVVSTVAESWVLLQATKTNRVKGKIILFMLCFFYYLYNSYSKAATLY